MYSMYLNIPPSYGPIKAEVELKYQKECFNFMETIIGTEPLLKAKSTILGNILYLTIEVDRKTFRNIQLKNLAIVCSLLFDKRTICWN